MHKLYAARIRRLREENEDQKVTLKDQQFCCKLQHSSAHLNCVCALWLPPLPSGLPLVKMVLFTFFPRVTKDFRHSFCHVAGFSADQLILSETFQDLMQMYKMAKYFKNQQGRDFFSTKKVYLTTHFRTVFLRASEQCETFSFRVNIIYLSNN